MSIDRDKDGSLFDRIFSRIRFIARHTIRVSCHLPVHVPLRVLSPLLRWIIFAGSMCRSGISSAIFCQPSLTAEVFLNLSIPSGDDMMGKVTFSKARASRTIELQ